MPSNLPGGTSATYLEYIYTQTFAAVPDQWPSPGAGSIGLGTDSAHHRRATRRAEPEDATEKAAPTADSGAGRAVALTSAAVVLGCLAGVGLVLY